MNRLKCILADDEPVARKIVREFIEDVPYLDLAGQFDTALKTAAFLIEHNADLLFLDIEMPGLSGIDFLKNCKVKPQVILTTAYPEYALQGYDLNVTDYLLKPISFERILQAAEKAKAHFELKSRGRGAGDSSYIFVRTDKRIEKIELSDILYLESIGNYLKIHTTQGPVVAYLTLKGVESQLPQSFVKIHQSFIVNFRHVRAIEGNQLKIQAKTLPLSRSYRPAVMQLVDRGLMKR